MYWVLLQAYTLQYYGFLTDSPNYETTLTGEMTHFCSGLLILDKPLLFPQQGNLQQQKSWKALNWTMTKNPNNKATLQFQL